MVLCAHVYVSIERILRLPPLTHAVGVGQSQTYSSAAWLQSGVSRCCHFKPKGILEPEFLPSSQMNASFFLHAFSGLDETRPSCRGEPLYSKSIAYTADHL